MIARSRIFIFFLFAHLSLAEEKHVIENSLLGAVPAGALAFAETTGLEDLIASIKTSPTYQTLIESDQFKEIQASEQYEELQDAVGIAEFFLRTDLWDASEKLFGGRAGLALYPKKDSEKPDLVFLLRPADVSVWSKQRIWTDPLLWFAADRVDKKRFSWGLKVYEVEGENDSPFYFALHKQWVALSTNLEILEKTISLQIDNPKELTRRKLKRAIPLANDDAFKAMSKMTGNNHLARALVDTKAIGGRLGLPKKMDNPLGSLLAGGILELAANSKFGTVTVDTNESDFVLEAGFDGDPKKLDEHFQLFFNDHPKSGTQPLPEVPGLIGGFTVYRDIATWYRSRDDLLVEAVLPEFDKFESGVGNLLPGKDIGEDVLPLMGRNVTFVSALQNFDHLDGEPGVKLPGFAFIIDLKEAEEATDIFQLFFQTLLAVLNFEAGEQERQPWLIDLKMHHDVKITTARYLDDPKGKDLPIVFNFLPASARVGDKYIVSSSLQLCEQLIDAVSKSNTAKLNKENLNFEVRFDPLAKILAANAEHFEAERVSEGRTAKQAKSDVALFLSVMKGLDSFSTSTSADQDGFKFRVEGSLNQK